MKHIKVKVMTDSTRVRHSLKTGLQKFAVRALRSFTSFILLLPAQGSDAQFLFVPNQLTNIYGNLSTVYPLQWNDSMRYQQVYSADQFPGPIEITELAFRVSPLSDYTIEGSLGGAKITLSTTPRNPDDLSTNFEANFGPDKTVVFNGDMSGSLTPFRPEFDLVITLATPFTFEPGTGNLLMEVIRNGNPFLGGVSLCAQNTTNDSISRVFAFNSRATNATASSSAGLLTRFGYLPRGSLVMPRLLLTPSEEIQFLGAIGHTYKLQYLMISATSTNWFTWSGSITGANLTITNFISEYANYRVLDEATNEITFDLHPAFDAEHFEVTDQSYEVQMSADLDNWNTLIPATMGRGGKVRNHQSTRGDPWKFLRLRVTKP